MRLKPIDARRNPMTRQAQNSEHASSLKLAFVSLLLGAFAAYMIVQGSLEDLAPWIEPLVWVAGAMTFGFGLARIFPGVFGSIFQAIGCLTAYSALMLVIMHSLDRELPSFRGTLDTRAVSSHLSTAAEDIGAMAEQSSEGMASAVAEMREVVGK